MFSNTFRSKALGLALLYSFVSLIVTEVMPLEKTDAEVEKSTPVVKVKAYGKKTSQVQKENFEKIIEEGRRLFQDMMDFEGAITRFKEAEEFAMTQQQKSDACFWLSLVYYATIAERGDEEFKETVRKIIEIDYFRELDIRLCPRNYVVLFQEIKAEYGVLKVQSRPPEADVYIDEQKESSGKTPFTVAIKAGSIDIRVRKGNREKKDTLKVESGKTTTSPVYVLKGKSSLLFILGGIALAGGAGVLLFSGKKNGNGGGTIPVETTGSIQVNSTPTGAKIYLDGTDTGTTTNTTLTEISPGSHIVKLVKEGYKDTEQNVSVTAGQTADVSLNLSQHTITVTSPTGSTIWEHGTEVEIRWTYDESAYSSGNISPSASVNSMLYQRNRLYPGLNNGIVHNNPPSESPVNSRRKFGDIHSSTFSKESLKESNQGRVSSSKILWEKDDKNLNKTKSLESIDLANGFNPPVSPKDSISFPNPSCQDIKSDDYIKILTLTNVKIELYRGGSVVETIASSTENDGSHIWLIPLSLQAGTNFKVRISCVDDANVFGESGLFEIKESESIYFFDDFEDGNADGWSLGEGWQVEKDGSNFVLSGSHPNIQHVSAGQDTWKNYGVKARIKLIEGEMQVKYRATDNGLYFIVINLSWIEMTKETMGNFESLVSTNIDINYNEWHTVEVAGNEGNLKVYFDDVLLLEYNDSDPILSGKINFQNSPSGHVHIDDVKVEEIR